MTLNAPKVRRPWALAYNLWGVLVVAWTVFLIVQTCQSHLLVPRWAVPAVGIPIDAVAVVLFVQRRKEKRRLAVAPARPVDPWPLKAPDAGAGQCPVCGMNDLDALAADDKLMERGPDRAKVVAWGRKRAHRDCAEFVPYGTTEAGRAAETHRQDHLGRRYPDCEECQRADNERWQHEKQQARRAFEESLPALMATAARGATSVRLNREPDPQFKHWMIALGPMTHNDILIIDRCERVRDGFGWMAYLAEPLRHELRVTLNLSNKLMPLESERLWNTEAGRPFTRTELGLCDCHPGPAATRPPRVSANWERLGEEFDRKYGDVWPELKGWRR